MPLRVKAFDGLLVELPNEAIEHILRKHPDMLSILNLTKGQLVQKIINTIEKPDEVYIDIYNARYFLKRTNDLYINVIVGGGTVRTTYLISTDTYARMRRIKWLRHLF